jgi:hypothetical protein
MTTGLLYTHFAGTIDQHCTAISSPPVTYCEVVK